MFFATWQALRQTKRAGQHLGELVRDLMPQESEKNDDRNGNSQQVKQNSTAHDFLLFRFAYPSVKLALNPDPSTLRGRQARSKGADKESGGEP